MIFQNDGKKFYRENGKHPIEVEEVTPLEEIEIFLSKTWSKEKKHNESAF